jgi:hypothetical protein
MMRFWLAFLLTGAWAAAATAQSGPAPGLVNITEARFGSGCAGAADPTGHRDSTCAIRAAFSFAEGSGLPGAGYPVLYFPHGIYKVAGEGYTSALTLTKAVSIQGDGAPNTVLLNTSPHAATLTYLFAQECSGKPGMCPVTVQGMTFAGQGHATAGGLIEINSTNTGSMRNVVLANTGGIALNLQGSSERWYFSDMEIQQARWPLVTEGDTNENYFERVNVLDGGESGDYCYSVNCPNGKLINSGTWRPDPHSAVYLDGDNVHWMDSSIKSTIAIGGIRLASTTSSVSRTYIEGFPWGGQPRTNHAVAAPGPSELGHLTRSIGAADLDFPVDDAGWQPLYVNDPSQARMNGKHSYVNAYGIFPADYMPRSQEPSSAVPGLHRGDFELVQVGAFSGDGAAHLLKRGDHAVAWPAGSVIEQVTPNGYGVLRLEEDHLNSLGTTFSQRYPSGCSDTEQRNNWTSSPSELCAEVIAGLVPDGYMVPFPTEVYVHQSYTVRLIDDSIYTGGSEQDGEGWVKVPGNATVEIDQGNEPLTSFVDAGTALHSYSNGVTRVQMVTYGGGQKPVSALGYVVDPSAGVRFSPQNGFYEADVMRDGALAHQYVHSECWYDTATGSAAPGQKSCTGAGLSSAPVSDSHGAIKFVLRDWQVNLLAPRGQTGDCQSRDAATGSVRFSTAADASMLVNVSPNPGAQVMAAGVVDADGTHVSVRMCNSGSTPVRWDQAPAVTVIELP